MPIRASSPPFTGGAVPNAITPTGGIGPAGGFSVSPRSYTVGSVATAVATPSTTSTYISAIFVPVNGTLTGITVRNGSGTGGNITVGLADSTGAPIAAAKSASTAQAGASVYQDIPFAAPYAAVGPATYYVQVQYSAATASGTFLYTAAPIGTLIQTGQTYGTFTSFTPPTTFAANAGVSAGVY